MRATFSSLDSWEIETISKLEDTLVLKETSVLEQTLILEVLCKKSAKYKYLYKYLTINIFKLAKKQLKKKK